MTTCNVNRLLVINACKRVLADRDERLANMHAAREHQIQIAMLPYRSWFIQRQRSRDQAESFVDRHSLDWYDEMTIRGGRWVHRAEQLLALSNLSGEHTIALSAEDADFLMPWVK